MHVEPDTFIDQIYEAAIVPSKWDQVLDSMSSIAGAEGSTIFSASSPSDFRWHATEGIRGIMHDFLFDGWLTRNSRGERTERVGGARFVSEADLYDDGELEDDPLFRDFLWPRGFGWGTGTRIAAPTGDTIVFSSDRLLANGPVPQGAVDALTRFRPHLARAALAAVCLGFQHHETTVNALQTIGLAAAVVGPGRRALATNRAFDAAHGVARIGSFNRIDLKDVGAQGRFVEACGDLSHDTARQPRSIPIPAKEDHLPQILHVLPIMRSARDIFTGAAAMILLTPFKARSSVKADWLQGLFDLTPAEARICQAIGAGCSVQHTAQEVGVAQDTVRKHLKSIFAKTGIRRQAELVAIISSVASISSTG